jgi:hypothetical protein
MNNRFESHEEFLKSIADLAGLVRGNSIKQKGRQLSMASQVVDALNGRMSNINTAMPKILPRSTATELQAATGSLADQTGEVLEPGVAQAFEGNLALDSSLETIESSANDEMPSFKAARRPALKLLKNSVPASDNQAWQEAEEAHWLRNPVIFMGSCLVVMILLILFW